MAKKPTSASSLSARATAQAIWPCGSAVAVEARLVMALDGVGHRRGLAVGQRVVAAHDALQLGELADHVGDQVGLGQQCGALGLRHVGAEAPRNFGRQLDQPVDALALAAELVVIHDARQLADACRERRLLVRLEEELGVGQARDAPRGRCR
jgi:hypothetical protein